jgi:hypothetical protein
MDEALHWPPSPDRHVDGFDDQFTTKMIRHRPPDNTAAVDVKHDRQVEEARPGRDIGDVGDPQAVRRGSGELALHEIGSRGKTRRATRCCRTLATVTAL